MALRARNLGRGGRTPLREAPLLARRYDHSPFMTLGDTSPGAKGMSAAAHEASEGRGYLVVVFAGEEAMDPVLVSDFPSLLDLLAKLAPIVNASATP